MSFIAVAMPILPGKYQQWRNFINELQGPRYDDFKASRDRYGLHERSFYQKTPDGDYVVVTLEGEDPMGAFGKIAQDQSPFMQWFVQQVKDVHGVDLRQPMPGPAPEFLVDSHDRQAMRRAA